MSPRQATSTLADTSDSGEGSKSRGLASGPRNSRRSNSAMSNARTRGSVSKDESESDQAGVAEGSSLIKGEPITAEPEEEEDDNGASGDSNTSIAQSTFRGRKKPGGKRRRGGAAAASSRTRHSRTAANNVSTAEGGDDEPAIKSEVDEEGAEVKDADLARPESEEAGDDSKGRHHRSASGFKELAGLGLKSLGDGETETLVPRRTRRGAVSPNEGGPSYREEGEDDLPEDGTVAEDADTTQYERQISDKEGLGGQGEDETAEEGVTRCLCGSADENVGLMIQCETCKCWQHCICMGMRTEEDCPDVYFCEQCRPELHVPLLRLLGVLPASRSGKKNGSKTQSGRVSAKDAAKELKEAKEAVLTLAKENERRRKEGREPVTGWSIAQEQEHQHMLAQEQLLQQGGDQHRRRISESRTRASRSQSGDDMTAPKSPPKRRSTMNSRDSAYGWESIPPGLLNDDDGGSARDTSEAGGGRKRSRGGHGEDDERQSPSPIGPSSSDGSTRKRRRMSSTVDVMEDRARHEAAEEDDEGAEEVAPSHSQTTIKKAARGRLNREQESKPKHPNQYTARRAAAAAAAAAASGGNGVNGSSSPSPSPSKRLADGSRRTTLRDVVNHDGQSATTMAPNGSQNEPTKSGHPGTTWGMPDHLSHLAYLLPNPVGPEPLRVNMASTKGMPSAPKDKSGHHSNAVKDSQTDRIIQASPQPFQMLSLVEPNTKIKFPGKRTTMGEMRKRVRNILEFVSRLQIESAERERRMKFLGITKEPSEVQLSSSVDAKDDQAASHAETIAPTSTSASGGKLETSDDATVAEVDATAAAGPENDVDMKDVDVKEAPVEKTAGDEVDVSTSVLAQAASSETLTLSNAVEVGEAIAATAAPADSTPQLKGFTELDSTSMSLVDELTRELLSFQQKFGTGTSGASTAMASSGGAF